ncbi:MAG: group III truncated hemoglobin [Pseudomonadota bacterium]
MSKMVEFSSNPEAGPEAEYNNISMRKDVENRDDVSLIVADFYAEMLLDPIIGYIFTDVAKIDLESHLPIITDFWADVLFKQKKYRNNTLQKHLDLHQKIPLTPGHFTRWLYLFNRAVDANFAGTRADTMKQRAELVAEAISAAIAQRKKGEMTLSLEKYLKA